MGTSLESPLPSGDPRWVAMFHDSATASWTPGAESPYREPVLHAVGEMAQTLRARGAEVTVALWGPKDGVWHRYDAPVSSAAAASAPVSSAMTASAPVASAAQPAGPSSGAGTAEPAKLAERMTDRRHQVLMAGLSKAGLYDLVPADEAAVGALVDRLDETTVRRVAHWLATAGAR